MGKRDRFDYYKQYCLSVVGMKYRNNLDVTKIKKGYRIYLEKEPDNTFDKNAVKCLYKKNVHMGYISKEDINKIDWNERYVVYFRGDVVVYIIPKDIYTRTQIERENNNNNYDDYDDY
jgi:primosomal protein N'